MNTVRIKINFFIYLNITTVCTLSIYYKKYLFYIISTIKLIDQRLILLILYQSYLHIVGINTSRISDCFFHVITFLNTFFTETNSSRLISESITALEIKTSNAFNLACNKSSILSYFFLVRTCTF